ncbi:MAG: type domain protein [Verrucomicrobia bacterium]|nr:type domain protein [Verrucomicrobiota bacterium]
MISVRLPALRLLLALIATPLFASEAALPVTIVVAPDAAAPEQLAGSDLRARLQRLYPDDHFILAAQVPPTGRAIVLTTQSEAPGVIARYFSGRPPLKAESFVVTHHSENGRELGLIAGADPRGASYGVTALLERLGYGFYLAFETKPPARAGKLNFDAWELADEPLFEDRIALNWQNFLSSATTWEYADWERYIDAVARLRFNDLMVHAYGNNPMFSFEFNGQAKPVGYFATTQSGRDWGTQHVNDVRLMIGGEVFSGPVFGANLPDGDAAQRVQSATALMQRVFARARARGLGVTFALDVDTLSANPANVIGTLPASARFVAGGIELANPDTPEGFAYYETQLDQLLARYPQITRVAVWFRSPESNTPWRRLQRRELPAAWQREFTGPDDEVSAFALAKIVHAFQRALERSARRDVTLAAGSWAFPFIAASDHYLPAGIPIIALDWWVAFDSAQAQHDLRAARSGRKIVPIVWAQHDDSAFLGRSYTPFARFASQLQRVGASGYGVLHWTTRPLDLYFKSTVVQTWKSTEDEALALTAAEMAAHIFGEPARATGGEYLTSWITEAPMFGRETTSHFIDRAPTDSELNERRGRARLELLAQLEASVGGNGEVTQLRYFERFEKFILSFIATQAAVDRASAALKHDDYASARRALLRVDPVVVIEDYVAAARTGEITRGEQAMIVSLNLRWLPDVISLRQAVGLEPVRYRIGEVRQEPLAQGADPNTYFIDEHRRLWKVIDAASRPAALHLGAISGDKLAPGRYTINGLGSFEAKDGKLEIPADEKRRELVLATREYHGSPDP